MRSARFCTFHEPLPYPDAVSLQETLVRSRIADEIPDTFLLLQHPPVITLGRRGRRQFILADESRLAGEGILLQPSSRGGDVTYHGPGQCVLYPILKLGKNEMGAHGYLHALESVAIETAKAFGIDAFRREGKAGAWCDAGKFSAIGFRFTRWVSSHGLSLNVCPNLAHFDLIVGCGLVGEPVTSFLEIMGADSPDMYAVALEISRQAQIVFQRDWSTVEPDALIG